MSHRTDLLKRSRDLLRAVHPHINPQAVDRSSVESKPIEECYLNTMARTLADQIDSELVGTEDIGHTCIDGGKCHHNCKDLCFRRECCSPFSDYSGPWKYEDTQVQIAGLTSACSTLSSLVDEGATLLKALREHYGEQAERGKVPLLDAVDDWLDARGDSAQGGQQ